MASRTVAGGPSASERPPDMRTRPIFPTAAAVAEGIHDVWYLIRDALRGRKNCRDRCSGGLALRARPPATVRDAIRRRNRGFACTYVAAQFSIQYCNTI